MRRVNHPDGSEEIKTFPISFETLAAVRQGLHQGRLDILERELFEKRPLDDDNPALRHLIVSLMAEEFLVNPQADRVKKIIADATSSDNDLDNVRFFSQYGVLHSRFTDRTTDQAFLSSSITASNFFSSERTFAVSVVLKYLKPEEVDSSVKAALELHYKDLEYYLDDNSDTVPDEVYRIEKFLEDIGKATDQSSSSD